jgi:hypothetical protein
VLRKFRGDVFIVQRRHDHVLLPDHVYLSSHELGTQILHDSMNTPNDLVPFKLAQAEANRERGFLEFIALKEKPEQIFPPSVRLSGVSLAVGDSAHMTSMSHGSQ